MLTNIDKVLITRELLEVRNLICDNIKPEGVEEIRIYFDRIIDLLEIDIEDINDPKLKDRILSLHERL